MTSLSSDDESFPDLAPFALDLPAFLRAFRLNAASISWFLGAGSSAMSGIPTGGGLIDQFRAEIYCTETGQNPKNVDIDDRSFRTRVDNYFAGRNGYPVPTEPGAYSTYFEAAYKTEADRQRFLYDLVADKRPNLGHTIMAALVAAELLRIVWQVNFDDLPQQAFTALLDSRSPRRPVQSVAFDNSESAGARALDAIQNKRVPLVVGLHGDYRYKKLKNITEELRQQDAALRQLFIQSCLHNGLAVVGFSGRDESIMEALRASAQQKGAFPSGLYWFHQEDSLADEVVDFLQFARANAVDAYAVTVPNFVELMTAIESVTDLADDVRGHISTASLQRRPTSSPMPSGRPAPWPVLRLNALPVRSLPSSARVLAGDAPLADLQQAIRTNRTRGFVAKRDGGQLVAFGVTSELQEALSPYGITVTNDEVPILQTLERNDGTVTHQTADVGLLRDALTLGLGRTQGLTHVLRRGPTHAVRVADANTDSLAALRKACGGRLTGTVQGTQVHWAEAIGVTLEFRENEWLLLFAPEIWTQRIGLPPAGVEKDSPEGKHWIATQDNAVKEFTRERSVARYNRTTDAIMRAWLGLLALGESEREVRTWNIGDGQGLDAIFRFGAEPKFCMPLQLNMSTSS